MAIDFHVYINEDNGLLVNSGGGEIVRKEDYPSAFRATVPTFRVHLLQSDGSPSEKLSVGDGIMVSVVVLKDSTFKTLTRTVDMEVIDAANGSFDFDLNANTEEWGTIVGVVDYLAVKLEVQITPSGGTAIKRVFRVPFLAMQTYDDEAVDPPDDLASDYPSWTVIQGACVLKSMFTAYTVIAAQASDGVPEAVRILQNTLLGRGVGDIEGITIEEGQMPGRPAGGVLQSMTPTDIRTLLSVSSSDLVILKSLLTAHSVAASTDTNGNVVAVTLAEDTLLGRIEGGNVAALTVAQILTMLGLTDAASDIDALQTLVSALDTDLNTLEGDVSDLQTAVGTLQTDLDAAEEDIVAINASLVNLENGVLKYTDAGLSLTPEKVYAKTAAGWVLFDDETHRGMIMGYALNSTTLILRGFAAYATGGLTIGAPAFIDVDTAGDFTQTPPTVGYTCVLGQAWTASIIWINPYLMWMGEAQTGS